MQENIICFGKGLMNSIKSLCHHYDECGFMGFRFHYTKAIYHNFNQMVLGNKKTSIFNIRRNSKFMRSLREIAKVHSKRAILSTKIQEYDFNSMVIQSDVDVNQSQQEYEHQLKLTVKERVTCTYEMHKPEETNKQPPRKRERPPKLRSLEDKLFKGIQDTQNKSKGKFTPIT
ncbi:hypothetical protein TRFO_14726 [Tritrichomonas foetus]|uniref:Uncharacterized protein n=1 Tax=Tritrichomonas foetus TaxID=1144522 RepID=A0A1J4KUH2_9EUKA|nr:hypothetical protein TRFO_14726 [Tritrichomonas foetus]|eukprot:OHT14919.1 hypothetical protein TRFO_14726 [Tritrichomonas foetus]